MTQEEEKRICPHCGAENRASAIVTTCRICSGSLEEAGVGAPEAPPEAGTPCAEPEPTYRNPIDGYEMVLIPAGKAIFGSPEDDPDAKGDGKPQFEAELPAYYLGRHCVTNAQYKQFVTETGHRPPDADYGKDIPVWRDGDFPPDRAEHPVVFVSWDDAQAYCEWAGLRLPTELEWEKGARGTEGLVYPWGNEWDEAKCRNLLNAGDEPGPKVFLWFREYVPTCPVSRFPEGASAWGCLNMSGNVAEWCADCWDECAYQRYAAGDLAPPAAGPERVCRGGCAVRQEPFWFRAAFRGGERGVPPSVRGELIGFRCARDVE